MIKEENVFDKYNKIWEKFSKIIKKEFNSKLIYNKKYLKTEKKSTQRKAFYILVILTNSVDRKEEICYPKMILDRCNCNYDIEYYDEKKIK